MTFKNARDLQDTAKWLPIDRLLIETFPYEGRHHLCLYGFAGRNAQQTLGLLLTKRMEDQGLAPLGFVATDYATLIWGLEPVADPASLLDPTNLRSDLESWLSGNAVMKRTFRSAAIIAGLIERTHQGRRKSGRQATFSLRNAAKIRPEPSDAGDHPRRGDAGVGGFFADRRND